MDSDQTIPQSVAEAPVASQNDRLKPYQENLAKALTEKLQPFSEKMNSKVLEMATKDMSQESGYKKDVIDNPWTEGIVHVNETWDGGSRSMKVYDDRYKTKDEFDNQPGEFSLGVGVDKSYDKWSAGIRFNPKNGSLTQEISCTTQRATKAEYGAKPLMTGEFFKWAGDGDMTEKTFIQKDGTTSSSKYWAEFGKWLGGRPDRYQTTIVKEDSNGVVEKGTAVHGVALGVNPVMNVVYNAGRR